MEKQEMTQDDKSAPDLELVKLIYHTAHKTAEDMAIPIPIVVSALVHAASVMAQIYDCRESFDSAIKVNRLEASPGGSHLNGLDTEDRACVIRRHRFYPWPVRRHGWRERWKGLPGVLRD
jgi:hypothetical protein